MNSTPPATGFNKMSDHEMDIPTSSKFRLEISGNLLKYHRYGMSSVIKRENIVSIVVLPLELKNTITLEIYCIHKEESFIEIMYLDSEWDRAQRDFKMLEKWLAGE